MHGGRSGEGQRIRGAVAACALAATALLAPMLAVIAAASGGSVNQFTIAATSLTVTNLAFQAAETVTSGTITLTVLHFTADSAVLSGLTEDDPCVTTAAVTQSWKAVHSTPATATTSLSGPITLLATSFSYVAGGVTVTYDATTLPPVGVLVPSGTLPQVQITATSLLAATAQVQQLTTQIAAC